METQKKIDSKAIKILIPFVVVLGIIILVKNGYKFGQWLHEINQ